MGVEYRIVGGHMVTLLVAAAGLSDKVMTRETADADFGAMPEVVADPRLLQGLVGRGYKATGAANRFVRRHEDDTGALELVIDILAPSYRGRLLSNQRHGELVVDEIPGLAFALSSPAVVARLDVRLLDGRTLDISLRLPDLVSAICLKAAAYRGRFADKDAVDLWRLMTAAYETGIRSDSWPSTTTARDAATTLRTFFGRSGASGLRRLSGRRADQARMVAMTVAVVGRIAGA
jgi:hypothetical protein